MVKNSRILGIADGVNVSIKVVLKRFIKTGFKDGTDFVRKGRYVTV